MACSHITSCELFVQFAMNPALELWKINYCESQSYSDCARYKKSLLGLPVSLTLLPNGNSITETGDNEIGAASLFNAIIKHQTSMIRSLLRVGIDINIKNIEGITPLMAAAEYGAEDIIKILLENNADVTEINNEGDTAYAIALKNNHPTIAKLISSDTRFEN
ncbi:hypothetical protein MNBD_GAMMA06-5 [hydrothermal vent metagenome]|uniref:Uncharacterized protein n=1 Tax=hydrothermal vent metagenome TaxID=652676 RepID=A0A3B0XBM7_9ZZZZ